MREYLQALVLGIVQGLTEFLPVSSSGHLEIAKFLVGDQSSGMESLQMTVVLHVATALSTCIVFRKDLRNLIAGLFNPNGKEERDFALKIAVSMIPATAVGLIWEDCIDQMFDGKLILVSSMFLITASLLLLTQYVRKTDGQITYAKAFVIGLAQALAIVPGISRSGSTIAAALLLNTSKQEAARFSFLMVLPLIFGKIIKDIFEQDAADTNYSAAAMSIGFVAALISGWLACKWMVELVKKLQLKFFAVYCLLLGIGFITYLGFFS